MDEKRERVEDGSTGERERGGSSTHLKFVSGEVHSPYERENGHLGG